MPSAIVIVQSIAKILAPTCFQDEAQFLNVFWTNMFSKHIGTRKHGGADPTAWETYSKLVSSIALD